MSMPRLVRARALLVLVPLAACTSQSPVQWSDLSVDTGRSAAGSATERVMSIATPAALESGKRLPELAGMCQASIRMTADMPLGRYATWWRLRGDSSVVLEAAYSPDSGRSWRAAATVDTVDHQRTGCNRPAPSIAAERDNVHIAYSLNGPEGIGIFFAHSMDRAVMFHAPVSIVYGDRLADAGIAAEGDRVVIAYVDPNTNPAQIGLAISRTQGHNFEPRTFASQASGAKFQPRVALSGDTIVVAWMQSATLADSARATLVTRNGLLR